MINRGSIIAFLLVLALSGCFDANKAEREALRLEMKQVEISIGLANGQISNVRSEIAQIEKDFSIKSEELSHHEQKVRQYMNKHKMAVGAIMAGVGGTAVAIDPDSEYSEDFENIGATVAAAAAMWALFNLDEVFQVADVINTAENKTNSMQSELASLKQQFKQKQGLLREKQNALSLMTNRHETMTLRLKEIN